MHRRRFLRTAAAAAALAFLRPERALSALAPAPASFPGGLRAVSHIPFDELLQTQGRRARIADLQGRPLAEVEVSEVADVSHEASRDRLEQISLLLRADAPLDLPQGSYRVDLPGVGSCELFLVPVVDRRPGCAYQAALTRFRDA